MKRFAHGTNLRGSSAKSSRCLAFFMALNGHFLTSGNPHSSNSIRTLVQKLRTLGLELAVSVLAVHLLPTTSMSAESISKQPNSSRRTSGERSSGHSDLSSVKHYRSRAISLTQLHLELKKRMT